MNRARAVFIIATILALASAGCAQSPSVAAGGAVSETRDGLMGTVVTVTLDGGMAEAGQAAAFEAAFGAVRAVDGLMSANLAGSEVSAVNAGGFLGAVGVSAETYGLVERAVALSELSGGAFDPAVGGLTSLWKVDGAFSRLPGAGEIAAALADAGAGKVELVGGGGAGGAEGYAIRLLGEGTRLDLGAIAKGYGADRAAAALRGAGVEAALIDMGGNIFALGAKPGADAWTVGIRAPLAGDGGVAACVEARDVSVVTSGGYQKFFEAGGELYHHILDPATGYPAESGLLSVSVVCADSAMADGLSTACFVLGRERGMALLEGVSGAEGIFISEGFGISVTSGLAGAVTVLDGRFWLAEG